MTVLQISRTDTPKRVIFSLGMLFLLVSNSCSDQVTDPIQYQLSIALQTAVGTPLDSFLQIQGVPQGITARVPTEDGVAAADLPPGEYLIHAITQDAYYAADGAVAGEEDADLVSIRARDQSITFTFGIAEFQAEDAVTGEPIALTERAIQLFRPPRSNSNHEYAERDGAVFASPIVGDEYRILFRELPAPYVATWYPMGIDYAAAEVIPLSSARTQTVHLKLSPGGTIRGHVELPESIDDETFRFDVFARGAKSRQRVSARINGTDFSLPGLLSDEFSLEYEIWHPSTFSYETSTPISVAPGEIVDAQPLRFGTIHASITSPFEFRGITFYSTEGEPLGGVTMREDEQILIAVEGDYFLRGWGDRAAPVWWPGARSREDAERVSISDQNTPEPHFTLVPAGWITGSVRGQASVPIEWAILSRTKFHIHESDPTDVSGRLVRDTFQSGPLHPDEYTIQIIPPTDSGYRETWSGNVASSAEAATVNVTEGRTSHVEIHLLPE